jgi:hypothetical protein
MLTNVDHTALKVNQATIIALLMLAFVLDQAWLVAAVAAVMAAGTLLGRPGFLPLYRGVLKPLGVVKPDVLADHPEPHRFAQGLGAVFLAVGFIFLGQDYAALGWGLAWLVVGLAALNLFAGFCVGCAVYYWLSRLRVPGFDKTPPGGAFPGTRPQRN